MTLKANIKNTASYCCKHNYITNVHSQLIYLDANGRLLSGVLVFVELPSQVTSKHYKENPAALDLSCF